MPHPQPARGGDCRVGTSTIGPAPARSKATPNQHRVGGKVQSGAIYMRTICRLGPPVERKQDTIASHWVPRPSGSGFHGIPSNPQSAYYSTACTGLCSPRPLGEGPGVRGIPRAPARTRLRVAPSSFWLEGGSATCRIIQDRSIGSPSKNNQSNPFPRNLKEVMPIRRNIRLTHEPIPVFWVQVP